MADESTVYSTTDQIYLTDYNYVKCADDHFDKILVNTCFIIMLIIKSTKIKQGLVHEARQTMRQYRNEINDLKTEILEMKYKVALESD